MATVQKTAQRIVQKIDQGGERLWRFHDFSDLPMTAVAQTLSRLTRQGKLVRLSKGIYYRRRPTPFGESLPAPALFQGLLTANIFPSGIAAANLLGFSTQTPKCREVATTAASLPRKLIGADTILHTNRPQDWESLSQEDAALLDILRRAGKTSELSPDATIRKAIDLLSNGRFERLAKIISAEPPRSRAIFGALGEKMGRNVEELRHSLNPLSRFDFGLFADLPTARNWYAKGILRTELHLAPKQTVFGEAPPDDETLVESFLKDKRFLIYSPNHYNMLGVGTTQLYNETIVYNHKRHGRFKLGQRTFTFRKKAHFPSKISKEFLLVDLVNNIAHLAEDRDRVLSLVKKRAAEMDQSVLRHTVDSYADAGARKFFSAALEG